MPYRSNEDFPDNLRRLLPDHAQDIYRQAFNHAHAEHEGELRQEEAASCIAWAAVKRSYVKTPTGWVRRDAIG